MIRAIALVDKNWRLIDTSKHRGLHLTADKAHFKALTKGQALLMGHKTFAVDLECQPLPGRRNIILTRQNINYPGAETISQLETFLASATTDVWIIGGSEVFANSLQFIEELHLTVVDEVFDSGLFQFPTSAFKLTKSSLDMNEAGYRFRFLTLQPAQLQAPDARGFV